MNQVMNVDLYGASLADVDGTKYVSFYVGQHVVDEKEESAKGIVMMKLSGDPSVYESLRLTKYPAPVEMHIRLKKAAGGRMGQHCVAIKPLGTQAQSSTKTNTAPAN
ncbi:hypothetical protein CBP51_07060 [Cellvibrio mixtus]|uniref:Uncharacterized protein n=1 Tax=Cellvibrio mixtus TaxID=39650 RepID=A0A266QA40_9GAMM|nr:hypothetical protein [Cellvibrio mixtus]OZY86763.1 hypothetical protein CBP51_07060 [Cellvibrio mixtus]